MSFFDRAQSVTFAGKAVEKLVLDGKKIWEAVSFKNWVRYSTEADGMTIYNGGLGYKDGYRIRSGGAEASSSGITISGFIPYKKGYKLYIYPPFFGGNTENTINFYNAAFEHLGQITDSGAAYGICTSAFKTTLDNGVSVLDLSAVTVSGIENVAFVRVGNCISYNNNGAVIASGSEMIVTKNEKIAR